MREGCPKPVASDTFVPNPGPLWASPPGVAFRSRLRDGDPLRLRRSGGGLPPSPANSSHPLGASSSSANFPPPAGKRGPGSQLHHPLSDAAPGPMLRSLSLSRVGCGQSHPQNALHLAPPWSFASHCSQTTTTSCHRRSVYRPFLTRLAIPELLTRLVDSSAQSGSLPLFSLSLSLSICSFHRLLHSLLFKAGFCRFQ